MLIFVLFISTLAKQKTAFWEDWEPAKEESNKTRISPVPDENDNLLDAGILTVFENTKRKLIIYKFFRSSKNYQKYGASTETINVYE